MGIKYNREYKTISKELAEEIYEIEDFYTFFEMDEIEFNGLSQEEKKECARTLADDIFYGLYTEKSIKVGSGIIKYNKDNHSISVVYKDEKIIHLI